MNAANQQPLEDRTLSDIAARVPGARAILREQHLDYCCDGDKSLLEAVDNDAQALRRLCDALERNLQASTPLVEMSTNELITTIIEHHHSLHREQLPMLIRLARKIEAIHRAHPDVPHGLTRVLKHLSALLDDHMEREERLVFPQMYDNPPPNPDTPIESMKYEHEAHGAELRKLREMTNDYQPPDSACRSWRRLYSALRLFDESLVEHIHIENNLLYPGFQF